MSKQDPRLSSENQRASPREAGQLLQDSSALMSPERYRDLCGPPNSLCTGYSGVNRSSSPPQYKLFIQSECLTEAFWTAISYHTYSP